ncbi:hypothetical protein [Paracoccus sp. MC1862]|uniref:hypothetical protein n=2 Tax=Paracoccus sp. MC1862 TaxID=2760307 RepID=UPI001F472946|nr:hypothetical protein [Paracoccus sp. MC1862]
MRSLGALSAMAAVTAALIATPAMSDPGHGKGNGGRGEHARAAHHCPPGLAKKSRPCVPPGAARKDDKRYYPHVGDVLRVGDYVVVRDPRRLNLAIRDDWRYYRDGDRAYRVDRDTRKVLAVIELIDAFTN